MNKYFAEKFGLYTQWVSEKNKYNKIHSNEQGVQISCKLLEKSKKFGLENNIRNIAIIMYGAGEIQRKQKPWHGVQLNKCLDEINFEYLDTFSVYKDILERNRKDFEDLFLLEGNILGHPSPKGYELIAGLITQKFFND